MGKRSSDQAVIDTLDGVVEEMARLMSKAQTLQTESSSKSAQVRLLSEVGRALQSTMEIDFLLRIILTAVTAGDGLGFNRAFLLLIDEPGSALRGRMAVGPADPSDAAAIWEAMKEEGRDLKQILESRMHGTPDKKTGIMKKAARFDLSLDASDNIVAESLQNGVSRIVESVEQTPQASKIARILENDHFLVVPLVAEGKKLGAIVADNFVTGRRIRSEDVRLLETFASQASLAIINASLHCDLQQRLMQLRSAHDELSRNHMQLLRAERLMALGGLAASFIHDLKTPLVSLGLTARSAAAKLAEDDPARLSLEKLAGDIMEVEAHLKDLAESAARRSKDTTSVDVSSVIQDAMDLMRGWIITSKVESVLRLKHGDAKIRGSAVEFKHMILNILHNSLEAMPDGGKLTVETDVEDQMVRISVTDTGLGIPDEMKPRVFSAFFTSKPKGSGLGLFIVKRIVHDQGGAIEFDSKEGEGTCFSIRFPIDTREPDAGHTKIQ
jgi:signal transduction histidine kinase